MEFLSKSLAWLKLYGKWVLYGVLAVLFSLTLILLFFKNKKIKALEADLSIMKAKLALGGLSLQYGVEMQELQKLKEEEVKIKEELMKVGKALEEKLAPHMTATEIANKFKELGLCSDDK